MDGLVLHGEDGQDVLVEVDALVVGEEDFVGLELDLAGEDALGDLDAVEGVVLEGVPWVGADGLVILAELLHGRVVVVGEVGGGADDDKVAVLGEEGTLAVELLDADGGAQGNGVLEDEEAEEGDLAHLAGERVVRVVG